MLINSNFTLVDLTQIWWETQHHGITRCECRKCRLTPNAILHTTNSLSQDYTNLDDHILQTSIDTPRFKPLYIYS